MVAVAALLTWATSAALGLAMLRRWPRPPRTAYLHLASAALGLAGWVGYLAASRPTWLAWTAFAWLLVVNTLGDLLMVGGRPWTARTYLAAARRVLGGRRPLATVHALLAPTTLVLVLVAALDV